MNFSLNDSNQTSRRIPRFLRRAESFASSCRRPAQKSSSEVDLYQVSIWLQPVRPARPRYNHHRVRILLGSAPDQWRARFAERRFYRCN